MYMLHKKLDKDSDKIMVIDYDLINLLTPL